MGQRAAEKFEPQHLKHAANMNVRVLRTTTLFQLMLRCEELDVPRAAEFLKAAMLLATQETGAKRLKLLPFSTYAEEPHRRAAARPGQHIDGDRPSSSQAS